MRDKLAAALAALLTVGTLAVLAATSPPAAAASAEAYSWRNVEIAGGGFVPGIVFNRTERDLIYARTDIGGAYRWNPATGRWVPLLDWVGWDNWGYNGVVSLATDPVEPEPGLRRGRHVHQQLGSATTARSCARRTAARPGRCRHCRSSSAATCPAAAWVSGSPIDPNRNSVLYLGAPSGNGLWRSDRLRRHLGAGDAFPNPGNYVQDPNDPNGYLTDNQGVVWVTFDETTGSRGAATRTIYVGVADKDNTVYRSIDAGATWARLAGQPTGFLRAQGRARRRTRSTSPPATPAGPYDGGKGDVWRYDTATGAWTRISPVPSSNAEDVLRLQRSDGRPAAPRHADGRDPGLVVARRDLLPQHRRRRHVDPDLGLRRLSEPLATATRMDISASPWLTFGQSPQPPEETPKLGWMTESMEIDPFNSDRMMYGTGATRLRHHRPDQVGPPAASSPSSRWRPGSRRPPCSTWSARRPARR